MSIPKKGSRKISVNEIKYIWLIRIKPTYMQSDYGSGFLHVAVEKEESLGSTLVIYTNHRHPKDIHVKEIKPVTPSLVANWIEKAIDVGWLPNKKGHQFQVKIDSENHMTII